MTVILAPDRPMVSDFTKCLDEEGNWVSEHKLQRLAVDFYVEHIKPAAESKLEFGGHVPVFISGVHDAQQASCLNRLAVMVDSIEGSFFSQNIPRTQTTFRTSQ
jgi:hypothetical protein